MTDLATLVVKMQADNSQYVKKLEESTAKLEKFAKEGESALGSIKEQFADIGAKLAAAFTVDKLIEFSSEAIESAASLEKLSQMTGIGVESLGSLRLAAAASGLSQEDLGQVLKKLNVNISEAAGNIHSKAGVAFQALGIAVTDASGKLKDAGALMPELADKFAAMADGPNKVAFAVALMGRQGQQMIPVLNGGAKGLAEYAAAAKAAGFTTAETAEAAEKFEQKLNVMKSTLIDGLGAQLTAKLLPAMSSLIDAFNDSGRGAGALSVIAGLIGQAFKVVATIVLEVAGELNDVGASIGAVAAAAVAAAHGNFAEAAAIWKQSNADNLANGKATHDAIAALWAEPLPKPPQAEIEKPEGPNLAEAEKHDAATVKLDEYSKALAVEAQTFGLGKAAMIDYELQFGKLHETVIEAGADAGKFIAAIHASAAALQTKVDAKLITETTEKLQEVVIKYGQSDLAAEKYRNTTGELGKALDRMADHGVAARAAMDSLAKADIWQKDQAALEDIDRKTLTLTGDLHKAAEAAFDFQNKMLVKNLTDTGDAAGLAKIATLKAQELAQADFNQLVVQAGEVTEQLRRVEDETSLAVQKGQLTELDGQAKIEDARLRAIGQLNQIHDAELAIAQSGLGNPKEIAQTKAFADSIVSLNKQTDLLTESVRKNLESSFADNFEKLIDGSEKFRKAVTSMLMDVEKMMLQMIAKNYAEQLFGTGGAGGGIASLLSSILGGGGANVAATGQAATGTSEESLLSSIKIPGLAAGGTIPLGSFGLVGEDGPELAYSGSQNMHIAPLSSAGGKPITVHNQFIVDAPGGVISQPSQMQTAAAAARSISQASRRNNQ